MPTVNDNKLRLRNRRVLSRRDNLLRTLFDVTQSYLHIKEARNLDAHHQDHDRQAFLEANDLKRCVQGIELTCSTSLTLAATDISIHLPFLQHDYLFMRGPLSQKARRKH